MKKILAILMSALLVLSLAACGGGASSSSAAGSEASSAASSTANSSGSVAAGGETPTIDAIVAAGELVMLTNATFPPFEYYKGTDVTGVDVELAQAVADKLGVKLTVIDSDFDGLIDSLKSGKGDLVAAGMSITEERAAQVDFSVEYVNTTLLIIVPVGSDITGPDDLVGKTIAVQELTTSDLFVTDGVDAAEILRFKGAVEAGLAVTSGKADAAVIDELTAQSVVNANDGELVLLEEELTSEQYAMAVNKGAEDLLAVVNEVLQEAVDSGKVEELIATHIAMASEVE